MTVLEVIDKTAEFFSKREVPSPRLEIELLLSHVLQLPRMSLYLQFDRPLEQNHLDQLRPLVKRRANREPLQHIIGTTAFHDLEIQCSPDALIPRPETETLIEIIEKSMGSSAEGRIADVGTGTGAIALALAQKLPQCTIDAFDISEVALSLARKNHSQVSHLKVTWNQSDLLTNAEGSYLAVVANLPYLTKQEMESLQPEVKHDPALALDGGTDGLDLIRKLIPQAASRSRHVFLEIGPQQAAQVRTLLNDHGFSFTQVHLDLHERERFVEGRRES